MDQLLTRYLCSFQTHEHIPPLPADSYGTACRGLVQCSIALLILAAITRPQWAAIAV